MKEMPHRETLRSFLSLDTHERTFQMKTLHCVKSVRIRSYSGSHFPAF